MINIKLQFSIDDAVSIFRNSGLEVNTFPVPVWLNNPHGSGGHFVNHTIWCVRNPHTGKLEKLDEFFLKYLQAKKNELFLNPEKLEIYNLFSKIKES